MPLKGYKQSKEHIEKHLKAIRGICPWNKNKKMSKSFCNKNRISKLNNHYKVGKFKKDSKYVAFHNWLNRTYGKPQECENKYCSNKSKIFQWSKIRGKQHSHNRKNYWKLCRSCHAKYDSKYYKQHKIIKK
jgi:hypothetical protein